MSKEIIKNHNTGNLRLDRAGLRLLLLFFFTGTVGGAIAQSNIPTSVTAPPAATARPLPYTPSPATDYFRTIMPVMPLTDTSKVRFAAPIDSMLITTEYTDGLGRPLESVVKQGSPLDKDLVSVNTYDNFGREAVAYLPYTATTNSGLFNQNPFKADSTFYKSNFPDEQINYGVNTFDGSPLNRIVKSTAPGNSWTGAGVGTSYSMRANTTADSVRLWTINIVNEDDVPSTTSTYTARTLLVVQTTDERGIKTVAYKDESGRTVLSKQQVNTSPSSGHYGWLCTYYVYDEMNHLRVVIPPKAVDALNTSTVNWNLSTNPTIKTGLCFSYFYDSRGRAIMKYIPGKGKNYFAYDLLDRIVMTQDANLRQTNQWAFVLYDGQSRPWRSGVITNTAIKDTIIAQASRSTAYPTLLGTYTITSETYYDDYSWISGGAPSSSLVSTYINSTNFNTSYNTAPDYSQPIVVSNRIRGAVTGTKRIILNTSTYLYSVNLYDDHGRMIQAKQTNYTGGTDIITNQYSFTGRAIRTHLYQQKSGTNAQTHTLLTKYSYDAGGRLKSLTKNIDGLGDKTIATNRYNELSQLQSKVLGSGIDSLAYAYNIRGWLTAINKSYIDNYNSVANYFGEAVFYNFGFTTNQLNGAIAGVKWKAAGDTIARAYGFTYDNANRVTKADFSQNVRNTTTWNNATTDFSASNITYDGGGNILTMSQKGLTIGSSVTIDSLKYQYYTNSNQLQKVTDAAAYTSTGLGDFRDTALATDDYAYDVNGNIIKDYNRKMHTPSNGNGAVYNLLDKPDSLVISGKATTYYYYDAGGNTLKKMVKDYTSGLTKTYLYLSGFVYLNDTLQYVNTEEGRIRWANKRNSTTGAIYYAFEYDYYLRDHLGNVRTVLTEGRDTATYAATMETADSAVVRALFSNVYDPVRTVSTKPANFDTDNNNHNVSLLTGGTGGRIGPSMVLKVMAGDKVQISTFAFFNTTTQPPVTDNTLLNDLLSTLVSGVTAQSGGKITSGGSTQLSNTVSPNILSFLNSRTYNSSLPKAYLNWVLLDDQFKYVAGNMGAMQVQAGSSKQALVAPLQTIAKNGYLYIYVSNQSPQNVYFDDLVIKHYTGPLLQEQSYYPFGLEMAGISDQAMGKLDSKNKFNGGTELEEDYGVNLYSTFYRKYDPQIGRFNGVDCQSEASIGMSVYQFAGNNPVMLNDPLGNKMTAGLWDRGNGYYDFPGEHHQQQSADPLAGTFMDTGNGGGSGYTFGGGAGEGAYARFWSNIRHGVNSGNDLSGSVEESTRFLYQYESTDGSYAFQTPNNDGVVTNQEDIDYDLIGGFTETTYTISPASLDNTYSPAVNDESLDWSGMGNAALGLLGGVGEWVVGGVGEWFSGGTATPLTVPLFVDGGVRIGANASRLFGYITGHKDFANAMPSNIGAVVGKGVDMIDGKSFYNYGYGQAIGGALNDVASFIATGGTGGPLNDFMTNPSVGTGLGYLYAYPGYLAGLYSDFSDLKP